MGKTILPPFYIRVEEMKYFIFILQGRRPFPLNRPLKWGWWQGVRQKTLYFLADPLTVEGDRKQGLRRREALKNHVLQAVRLVSAVHVWSLQVGPSKHLVAFSQLLPPVSWCSSIDPSIEVGVEGLESECCVLEPVAVVVGGWGMASFWMDPTRFLQWWRWWGAWSEHLIPIPAPW